MERTQKGDLDTTPWTAMVHGVPGPRLRGRGDDPRFGSAQSPVWDAHAGAALNSTNRQRLAINRLLGGFEGKADLVQLRGFGRALAGYGGP